MKYSLSDIFDKISKMIDVVYLIDLLEDTYTTLKDNDLFHSVFGNGGEYSKMLSILYENTSDKNVAESTHYSVFLKKPQKFTGTLSNSAKIRIQDKEVSVSLSMFPVDDTLNAILIKEISEDEYNYKIHNDQHINAIKSAYLFSMNVDLIKDSCYSMNMSEIENTPVYQPEISYTDWRKTILNMFPSEEHETFNKISDPEYLKNNLRYHCSKSVDCQMMNLEGKFIWVKLIFNRIDTGYDDDFRFIFMVEDIHESHMRLMEEMNKYENLANHDSLTGLMNHSRIESEIKLSIEKYKSENKPVSLIMFDIDHFKRVNDTYGHAAGDYLLKELSSMSSEYLISHGGKIGRWGGEEFIGVCENVTVDEMAEFAEEIRTIISEYEFSKIGNITCSFGVTQVKSGEPFEAVFERVDAALYQAKNDGRNRVVVSIN